MQNSMYSNSLFWPLTLIFVGFVVFAVNVGMLPEGVWRFWPGILIIIGLVGLIGYMDGFSTKTSTSTPKTKTKKASKKSRR